MNRRGLLKGMMALPFANALGCRAGNAPDAVPEAPDRGKGVLRIVLNGAFAIVIQKNARNRLRVFSPRELSNLHEFYFNDPREPRSKTQAQNFELLPDGLELSRRAPEVDSNLAGFNVKTDLWCQDEYFVTIDLPAPQKISFIPPLHTATLSSGGQIRVPSVHVLEYRMTDPAKVRMVSEEMKETKPLYFSDLVKNYGGACSQRGAEAYKADCQTMQKRYESAIPGSAAGYFFGVGLASGHQDAGHAVQFFNTRVLASFPHLARKLELKSIYDAGANPKRSSLSSPQIIPADWQPETQTPRLLEVASVVDCLISGPIVTHPAGGGD